MVKKLRILDKGLALKLQGSRALGKPWGLLYHVTWNTKAAGTQHQCEGCLWRITEGFRGSLRKDDSDGGDSAGLVA